MSASDALHPKLFHGTNALLGVGDTIHALAPSLVGDENPVANATTDKRVATYFAKERNLLSKKPQLFSAVYEVTPVKEDPTDIKIGPLGEPDNPSSEGMYLSKSGFRINRVHYVPWNV